MSPTGAKYEGRCLPTLRCRGLIGRALAGGTSVAGASPDFLGAQGFSCGGVQSGGSFLAAGSVEAVAGTTAPAGKCEGRCFPIFLLLGEAPKTALSPLRLARIRWPIPATEQELELARSGVLGCSSGTGLGLRLCDAHA